MLRFLNPKSDKDRSDADLIARFQRSKRAEHLVPLYERYAELIYAVSLRYLSTPQRAEDAGMEIFEVLLKKLPEHQVSNFRSWLQTLVRNHCLMQLRKEKRDPLRQTAAPLVQSEAFGHLIGDEGGAPIAIGGADIRPLHHCMKQLKEEQRQAIRLFYLTEGESYQTIAEKLNLTVGRVRSHLQNGRRNLKICLEAAAQREETN